MSDPNVYQGPGEGGTHHVLVNVAAEGADNTGGADAGPTFTSQLALTVGKSGQSVWTPKGLYKVQTPIVVASNDSMRGCSNATIQSTIPYVNGFTDCLFASSEGASVVTTLTANAVEGADTIQVASVAALAVGNKILINSSSVGDAGLSYIITKIVGLVVTVDTAIAFNFAIGNDVSLLATPTSDVRLDFQNAVLTGTGGRTTWFAAIWDSVVENVQVQSAWTVFGLDFDLGSRNSTFRKCVVTSISTPITGSGIIVESGQGALIEDCVVNGLNPAGGSFTAGIYMSGYVNICRASKAVGCSSGLLLAQVGTTDLWASKNAKVSDCSFDQNGTGVQTSANSFGNELTNVSANYNTTSGFDTFTGTATAATTGASNNTYAACDADLNGNIGYVTGDASTACDGNKYIGCSATNTKNGGAGHGFWTLSLATNTKYVGCVSNGNAGDGFNVQASTDGTVLIGCSTELNTGFGYNTSGDTQCIGLQSIGDLSGNVQFAGASNTTLSDSYLEWTANGFAEAIQMSSSGVCRVSGTRIKFGGTGVKLAVVQTSGTLYLDNVNLLAGGSFGIDIQGGALYIGPGCSMDSAATPYTSSGGTTVMAQTGGVAAISGASAAVSLTFAQHYNTAIELASGAANSVTVTTYAIPGLTFIARNLTAAKTLTVITTAGGSVTVAAGKSAIVAVNGAGDLVRVTADT